jgi:RNA polymerase sigma factor (sigma-70 family)
LAADLTAEVFAAGLEAALRTRHTTNPAAWLYGIARHKLIDSLRRGQVEDVARRRLGFPPIELTDAELERTEALLDLQAEADGLERLLADLPAHERTALQARIVNEREYVEIAAELRCSEAVVRQRVSRGLRRLRAALREDG